MLVPERSAESTGVPSPSTTTAERSDVLAAEACGCACALKAFINVSAAARETTCCLTKTSFA